ncbi:MAG: Spy/CpxP family protein refolding chaperone [Bryobacteraceae bacterium]
MNRREMFMLPAVALVAQQGFAQAAQVSQSSSERPAQHVSHKVLLKYSRPKAISKVPKTQTKTAKYLNSLNTLLGLTPSQQQQATTMFTAAVTARAAIRSNMKAARQGLTTAILNNDSAGINQASMALGGRTAQLTAAGAFANAAFYQILTTDQKSRLSMTEFKG